MKNINTPLVSIVIITYNSSKHVLETLESAKVQTYQNIELIVSDDCSTDNTVEICKNWIEENKERFVRTELITVDKNTGIAPNCNRGFRAAKGEWIKGIAGDDTLTSNCILDNIDFCNTNSEIKVIHSSVYIYNEFIDEKYLLERHSLNEHIFHADGILAKEQYQVLLLRDILLPQSLFLKKEIFQKIEFDENIPLLEDYPFYLNILKNNIKFWYIEKHTANYRANPASITAKKDFFLSMRIDVAQKYVLPYLNGIKRFFCLLDLRRQKYLLYNNIFIRIIRRCFYIMNTIFYRCALYLLKIQIKNRIKSEIK